MMMTMMPGRRIGPVTAITPELIAFSCHLLIAIACMTLQVMGGEAPDSPSGALEAITGTMMFAPYAVLCGECHTVSSCLEGLFISIVSISCDGRMHGQSNSGRQDRIVWQGIRLAQFGLPQMRDEARNMAPHLWPLVTRLHDLFWSVANRRQRIHQTNVTPEMVQAVCQAFLEQPV